MLTFPKVLRHAGSVLALAAASLASYAAPLTTQLGFLIDDSGSISSSNFNTMKQGYAAALAALPVDGSIEVTVYKFSTNAVQVVAPVVLSSQAALNTVVAAINAMTQSGGSTATAAGITAISNAMIGSTKFNKNLNSMINIATDGQPNIPSNNADQAAINAAKAAEIAGIDALTAEAIGSGIDTDFLRDLVFNPTKGPCNNCGTVLTNIADLTNPMIGDPWVLKVANYSDFGSAINTKVQASISEVPEPGVLVLLAVGLIGLGMVRRSRSV